MLRYSTSPPAPKKKRKKAGEKGYNSQVYNWKTAPGCLKHFKLAQLLASTCASLILPFFLPLIGQRGKTGCSLGNLQLADCVFHREWGKMSPASPPSFCLTCCQCCQVTQSLFVELCRKSLIRDLSHRFGPIPFGTCNFICILPPHHRPPSATCRIVLSRPHKIQIRNRTESCIAS
jgi:hypothetical protein